MIVATELVGRDHELEAIRRLATRRPVLMLVDDAQWLDRWTAEVLGFVARRLESDLAMLLAAAARLHGDAGVPVTPAPPTPVAHLTLHR